jgi:hypothetical protein
LGVDVKADLDSIALSSGEDDLADDLQEEDVSQRVGFKRTT